MNTQPNPESKHPERKNSERKSSERKSSEHSSDKSSIQQSGNPDSWDSESIDSQDLDRDRSGQSLQSFQENLQEQQINLKLEVERLYRDVEGMRGGFQTLVSGLVIAILIAIGISSWFAYRLLVQEQQALQEAQSATELNAEMLKRVEQLESNLASQNEEIQVLKEQIKTLESSSRESLRTQQETVQDLSDRLTEAESAIRKLNDANNDTKTEQN